MFNKVYFIVLCFFGFYLSPKAAGAETKVGFVSIEQIMTKSAPAVHAQKKLDKEFEKRASEINAMGIKLRDAQIALAKTDPAMSEADRRTKERDWNVLNGEYQRKRRELNENLNQRRGDELKSIQERTFLVIRQIAEAGKYDLIVQDAIYHSDAIDLTPQVLKALSDK